MPDPPAFNPVDEAQRNERLHHFSHALKNRLGGLWQAATLLHDLPDGPERKQLLDLAERNFFNGARELEELMEDFRVPRGLSIRKRSKVSIGPIVEQCIGNISFRTNKKEQKAELMVKGPSEVYGDHDMLRQLVEALLSNASKFSPARTTIKVDVRTEADQVCVLVEDQGVGLSEEDLDRVFMRYVILGSRSTAGESQARSTLARAKQWAEAHHGSLEAYSNGLGKGSSFTVRLPRAKD